VNPLRRRRKELHVKRTTTITKTATAPTGHPHPLLTADAIAQTRQRADQLAEQLAEESADRYIARNHPLVAELLNDDAREHGEPTACPDGITWCIGKPANHDGSDETYHEGREYALRGAYLQDLDAGRQTAAFNLAKISDGPTRFVFQGTGLYPDLPLSQVDELVRDVTSHAINLRAVRRLYADALRPARTGPIRESEDEQTSHAAFSVAADALGIALEKSADRAKTLAAMRVMLDMHTATEGRA
jgi:hypothetical protein